MKHQNLTRIIASLFMFSVLFCSCGQRKTNREVEAMIGTRIVVPVDSLLRFSKSLNTASDSATYRYVVFYDSVLCSTCSLKNMLYWELLKDSVTSLGANVDFLFIFQPPATERGMFVNELRFHRSNLNIFVDTSSCFLRNNSHIPHNTNTHAFVLNNNNKIVLVGNAQNNPHIENLFFRFIKDATSR